MHKDIHNQMYKKKCHDINLFEIEAARAATAAAAAIAKAKTHSMKKKRLKNVVYLSFFVIKTHDKKKQQTNTRTKLTMSS